MLLTKSNEIDHSAIRNTVTRWYMARWNILRRCNGKPQEVLDASLQSLQSCIIEELIQSFPVSSQNKTQLEAMCKLAGKIAYGLA